MSVNKNVIERAITAFDSFSESQLPKFLAGMATVNPTEATSVELKRASRELMAGESPKEVRKSLQNLLT